MQVLVVFTGNKMVASKYILRNRLIRENELGVAEARVEIMVIHDSIGRICLDDQNSG